MILINCQDSSKDIIDCGVIGVKQKSNSHKAKSSRMNKGFDDDNDDGD